MKQYRVALEGGLVIEAARHEERSDALVFFDDNGGETLRIPREAIYTYDIEEM